MQRRSIYLSILAFICAVGVVVVIYELRHRGRKTTVVMATPKICSPCAHTVVLSYEDFGPPSGSYELEIGNAWNQWKNEGHELPDDVDIKVVVYRGVELEAVRKQFPVVRGKSDYRYLEYGRAVQFLQQEIKEVEGFKEDEKRGQDQATVLQRWDELIQTLVSSHTRIIENLGS